MRPHAAFFLVFFLLCPVNLQTTNDELTDIIAEIISMMPHETSGIAAPDDWFTYANDPDLYIPPSLYCKEYFESDEVEDVNTMMEYNPFKVYESKTNHYDRELNVFLSAVLADSIYQGWVQPTGNHLNYHFAMDVGQVSLKSYDEPFPAHMEMYPALMMLYLPNGVDICTSGQDDLIDVNIVISSDQWVCPFAKVQVNKEMFLDMEKEACACRPLNGSACYCYEPDIVTSTEGFNETGQVSKAMVPRFDASGEPWYTKIQEYPRMMLDLYTSYDVIVTQIHQRLEAVSLAPFCCYEDTWYRFGERIPIPEDPCLMCICDAEWMDTDDCTMMECPLNRYINKTGDTDVEVVKITGMCCGQTKEVIFQDFCMDNDACEPHGECTPLEDDFTCDCEPGYEPSPDGHSCEDVDECAGPPQEKRDLRCPDGTCNNLNGTYECICDLGYDHPPGDNKLCLLSNMCLKDPELCQPNGMCNATLASYICDCDDGYEPTEDLQDCVDINECESNATCPNGTCHNLNGTYDCDCDPGFEVMELEMGPTCIMSNHCIAFPEDCEPHGDCRSTGGDGYVCDCHIGFNQTDDGHDCVDIDECEDNMDICGPGECNNTDGGYVCDCNPGYEFGDGDERLRKRQPDEEAPTCLLADSCLAFPDICDPNGICDPFNPPDYRCNCSIGFENPPDNNKVCVDINECLDGRCTPNGACVNVPQSYFCDCDEFFVPTPDDQCIPLDMCLDPIARCTAEAECIDGDRDMFICQCPPGKTFDPVLGECVDDLPATAIQMERAFDEKNDTAVMVISENTNIKFYTNSSSCQYYLQLHLDFDLSFWHENMTSEDCRNRKKVDRTPYIAVRDPYDDNIEHWYCGWSSDYVQISYFDTLYVRTNNAGQNQITFTITVMPFQGSGACCGGVLHAVPETENPFNQIGVTSANYPAPYNNDEWCSWVIKGPADTTEGKIAVFIIDFTVVVLVPDDEEDTLDCHEEDALFVSNTGMMTGASGMCGTFPEVGKLYTPGQVFIHWQTNGERVTRGFQMMYYHVTSTYGITIFERSLTTVCGLIPLARNKRDEEEYDDDDDFELEDEKTIYVPQGVSKPAEAVPRSRTKRVASAGGATTTRGETPFLVVLEIVNKKDKNAPPFKYFYGVLIAENFVVSSSQAKHYQEADTAFRKIKLRFGVYDFSTRLTDDWVLFKSALKIYKHAQCETNILGEPYARDPDTSNWEYTNSNLKACPMLMVTGNVPTNDMIQPAYFPWFTFSWKSSMAGLSTFSKRIFHIGFMSDAAGTAVLEGVSNKPRRISMQRTFDTACLEPLDEPTIAPQRVCTFATNGKGACMADLGGPKLKRMIVDNEEEFGGIIRHWVVMGILVKAQCGSPGTPNDGDKSDRRYQAYIEVNAYMYWMQQVMQERQMPNCRRPMTDEALAAIPTSP